MRKKDLKEALLSAAADAHGFAYLYELRSKGKSDHTADFNVCKVPTCLARYQLTHKPTYTWPNLGYSERH